MVTLFWIRILVEDRSGELMSDVREVVTTAASAFIVLLSLFALSPLYAQEQEPQLGTAAERGQLEEILVTARKREERLQDVPISITAFSAKGIRDRNIQNAYDLANFTPNFQFTPNLGRRLDVPNIRGQFGALNPSTDPNASFFVDGVYVDGSIGSTSLANLERVEILRGPQSAQFGRATFAGAVNYITRRATNEFEGELNAKAGDDKDVELGAWASGPIIEDKLFFFAGASYESWDGEWRNNLEEYDVVNGYSPTGYDETGGVTGGAPGEGVPFGLDVFPGGFTWSENPNLDGDPPCVVNEFGNNGSGCANTVSDHTEIGGEETKLATVKLTWDAFDNLQFNLKYERVEANDGHFVYLFVPPAERNNCFNRQGGGLTETGAGTAIDPRAGSRSGGFICGELTDDGYNAKMNITSFRRGVTTMFPQLNNTSERAPFIGLDEDRNRYMFDTVYDFADYQITARYAHNDRKSQYVRDLDRTYAHGPVATGLFESHRVEDADDDSLEFRLASPGDQRLRWSVGYYWFDRNIDFRQRDFNGFSRFELGPQGSGETTNNAIFGSTQFDLTDTLTFAFEGRYAEDEISRSSPPLDPDPEDGIDELVTNKRTSTYYSFSPRATLTWAITEDITTYWQIAEGNKPGGFNFAYFDNDADPTDPLFDPSKAVIEEEEATTWEWGLKGTYLDGTLQANLAVFYIDWTNQAINVSDCIPSTNPGVDCETQLVVDNAAESEVKGLEIEGTWFATDRLSFTLGYGYTDSELEDYVDDELAVLRCQEECYETDSDGALTPDAKAAAARVGDVKGNSAPRVPKHNLALSQAYQAPLIDELEWFFRNDFMYESKKYSTVSNLNWAPSQWTWNARVGLDAPRWSSAFYIDNVTNEKSPVQIQDFPLFDLSQGYRIGPGRFGTDTVFPNAFLLQPRRTRNVGVTFSYRFGAAAG
jgi:outer membrane receptor protein involved in Fe transport